MRQYGQAHASHFHFTPSNRPKGFTRCCQSHYNRSIQSSYFVGKPCSHPIVVIFDDPIWSRSSANFDLKIETVQCRKMMVLTVAVTLKMHQSIAINATHRRTEIAEKVHCHDFECLNGMHRAKLIGSRRIIWRFFFGFSVAVSDN